MSELDPYKNIKFVKKHIEIKNKEGKITFNEDIDFPEGFDDGHAAIVASRYLCNNAKLKETSLKQMIDRVSDTITNWARDQRYFEEDKTDFPDFNYKLKYYQIHQYFAFNSPVYFNVGLSDEPQTSACFILKIDDNMKSIFEVAGVEAEIFKHGSGTGMNMSPLRSKKETVSRGGHASGPCSFLRCHDVDAGTIKSAGTLRRSAKMVCMNIDHPDIEDFIEIKDHEEEKLRILRDAGFIPREGYEMSDEAFYQNTNISVRLSEAFMKAAEEDGDWYTKFVKTGENCTKYKARDLLVKIAEHAWKNGDPGILFSDTFNEWHTCINSGKINSTNPCGEFAFIDNSSCNLASINLLKFFKYDKYTNNFKFDYPTFKEVVEIMIIAQDILINKSSYPTEEIKKNTREFRPLGAGFTNLGALLMYLGLPYDSDEARTLTGMLTGLLTAIAYQTSNKLATIFGPFDKFEENKEPFYNVLNKHIKYLDVQFAGAKKSTIIKTMEILLNEHWLNIKNLIDNQAPFRNATVTLLAPTGTISSLMEAYTTGMEPEFSLIRYKTLSGSENAVLKFVNPIVEVALENLGYTEQKIKLILETIEEDGSLENSTIVKDEHMAIFDTSMNPRGCTRMIDYMGHVKMCAAIQPFISMGMSKTINLPNSATVKDVYGLYIKAWKMGLKGITIYRDGSKAFQPLSADKKEEKKVEMISQNSGEWSNRIVKLDETLKNHKPIRKKLPDDRPAHRHKFRVGNVEGYLAPGFYEDGSLGEIFIDLTKEGSTLSGFADALATIVSISLQYGIPLKDFVKKMMFLRFDPAGFTSNADIRSCTSIVDYIFKYLGMHYLSEEDRQELGLVPKQVTENGIEKITKEIVSKVAMEMNDSAPTCPECGSFMRLLGSCWTCVSCAWNEGSCG